MAFAESRGDDELEPAPAAELVLVAHRWMEQAVRTGSARVARVWLEIWRDLRALAQADDRRAEALARAIERSRRPTAAHDAPPDAPGRHRVYDMPFVDEAAPDPHDVHDVHSTSNLSNACAAVVGRDLALSTVLDPSHPARAGP